MTPWWRRVLAALVTSTRPERPRVVEDELAKDYGDVEGTGASGAVAWRPRMHRALTRTGYSYSLGAW